MATTTFSGPVVSQNGFEYQSNNAYSVTIEAPDSLAADYTLILPADDGTNGQILSTNGSGTLSWINPDGAGTVTSVGGTGTVNGLTLTGTVTTTGNLTLGGTLDLSSPPAIGATAPAAGTFTTLAVKSDNANAVSFLAPAGLAASYNILLPADDGNNGQVLSTNGSGTTTWANTVTSVGGTGTVNGLTLTGTVTTTGDLTLGGTLDLSSPPAIGGTAAAAGSFTSLTADTLTVQNSVVGVIQALSGPGAVNLTDPITAVTTTGADALTLANGTAGQYKTIIMVVDGGDGTLTPTSALGYTTITFDAVGDAVTLVYTSAGWAIVGINGAVAA